MYKYLPCAGGQGVLEYPYIQGSTVLEEIRYCVKRRDKEKIIKILLGFYNSYFTNTFLEKDLYTTEFQEVFGSLRGKEEYLCIKPANVDLICENIFWDDNKGIIIDYEWVFDFSVPVAFIMWRMINDMYTQLPELEQVIKRQNIYEIFEIDCIDQENFLAWSKNFAYVYVGCDKMSKYAQESIKVNLNETANSYKHNMLSKLYFDRGRGLNEDDSMVAQGKIYKNRFEIYFDLSAITDIGYMRLDILDNACWCIIDRIDCNCQMGLIPYGSHVFKGRRIYFLSDSPGFIVDTFKPDKVQYIRIEGRIEQLSKNTMLRILNEMSDDLAEKEKVTEKNNFKECEIQEQDLVEAEDESIKQLLKKLIKKLCRKEEKTEQVIFASRAIGSVDVFNYENAILHVAGWAFDMTYKMENPRIVYYHGEEEIATHGVLVIYRSDVAKALGKAEAEESGLTFTAQVSCMHSLKVVLEYDTPKGKGGFELGIVPGDRGVDETVIIPCMDERQIGDLRYFLTHRVAKQVELPPVLFGYTIDIILPVYNGYQYFDALFSSLELTNMKYRLLIVNDKSSDARVLPYLINYTSKHSEAVLINNEKNLGFVGSVNCALSKVENHVVLLNTDVEVPYQWLERLMLPIICYESIASTTPFTNCGTICSFPKFCEDNELFEKMKVWQVDDAFRNVMPQYPVLPTGVGFCMGMNLEVIQEIGLLDADTFGKGYGEENDWCQRAIKRGYKNVQVDNLYVYHKHGGSFLTDEKRKLLEENSKALLKKHPNYDKDVAQYCQKDPMKSVRLYVMIQLLNQQLHVKTTVAFDHSLGGGATEYLDKKKVELIHSQQKFITIRYNIYDNKYYVLYEYKMYKIEFFTEQLHTLLLSLGRVDEIWINELVTYQNVYKVLDSILKWKNEQGAELKMLVHDYFALCPAINLLDAQGNYCGVGTIGQCNHCIPQNQSNACLDFECAEKWRKNWGGFLQDCDEVTVFSLDSKRLLKRAYPELENLKLVPHEPHYLPNVNREKKITNSLNIGLLGVLSYKKGLHVVEKLADLIEEKNINVKLRLIGEADEEIQSSIFSQTGKYKREQLPKIVLEQDIDMFFCPSICPETFSYTVSEIMSMGYPIAIFDIGAPVERVQLYDKGLIIKYGETPEKILNNLLNFMLNELKIKPTATTRGKVLFVAEEISFASRYRVEHFQETLLKQGICSDYIQMDEVKNYDFNGYNSIVLYRCSNVNIVNEIVKESERLSIPVYYDIDDFIFDYDKIDYLEFLQNKEYSQFRIKTEQIHQCMEMCKGYMTSTNTLAAEIMREFPNKKVVIKRNVASIAMQILSNDAWKNANNNNDRIWIGYFSGSITHNKDFAQIECILKDILERYPQVYLKLGGVIQENGLGDYRNRIEKVGFTEWKNLPNMIANVAINLMPLEDTCFHSCKSENKWMEAALVHVPSVMSYNVELEKVIVSGKTGFLCANKEEWYTSLKMLIEDENLRRSVGDAAFQRVMERYTTNYPDTEAVKMVLGELKER